VKLWIVGLISGIILAIPLVILGVMAFSAVSLGTTGPGVASAASGLIYLLILPISIALQGYLAQKIWKWK
jgi:hypothetical protein